MTIKESGAHSLPPIQYNLTRTFSTIPNPAACPVLKTKNNAYCRITVQRALPLVATDATRARVNDDQGYQHIVGTNNTLLNEPPATRIAHSSPHCPSFQLALPYPRTHHEPNWGINPQIPHVVYRSTDTVDQLQYNANDWSDALAQLQYNVTGRESKTTRQ